MLRKRGRSRKVKASPSKVQCTDLKNPISVEVPQLAENLSVNFRVELGENSENHILTSRVPETGRIIKPQEEPSSVPQSIIMGNGGETSSRLHEITTNTESVVILNNDYIPPDRPQSSTNTSSDTSANAGAAAATGVKRKSRARPKIRSALLSDMHRARDIQTVHAKRKSSPKESTPQQTWAHNNSQYEPQMLFDPDICAEVVVETMAASSRSCIRIDEHLQSQQNLIPLQMAEPLDPADNSCIIISDDDDDRVEDQPNIAKIDSLVNSKSPSNKRKLCDVLDANSSSKIILIDDQSDSIDLRNNLCSEVSELMNHKSLKSRKKYHKEITNALAEYISNMSNESVESKVNRWVEKSFGSKLDPPDIFNLIETTDKKKRPEPKQKIESQISGMVATKMVLNSPSQLVEN